VHEKTAEKTIMSKFGLDLASGCGSVTCEIWNDPWNSLAALPRGIGIVIAPCVNDSCHGAVVEG